VTASRVSVSMTLVDVRLTHIGGPTVLIEAMDWRLLTDPTFDPPGQSYRFGWGTGSRKLTGPAMAASDLGHIDAVLLSHDHHEDNLDAAGREVLPAAGRHRHRVRGETPRGQRPGSRAMGDHAAGGRGTVFDRDHRHAVSPWPSVEPPRRRRRDRVRA
jgi:hypothetical protein